MRSIDRRRVRRASAQPTSFGESNQENRIRHSHADGHDCAHERLNVQRRSGQPEREHDACNHSRNSGHDNERQLHRLEVGRQQQEYHNHGEQEAGSQAIQHLLHRHDLSAQSDADPWRRIAQFFNRLAHLLRNTSQVRASEIGGHGYHPLHVVAFVLTDGGALGDVCYVAE